VIRDHHEVAAEELVRLAVDRRLHPVGEEPDRGDARHRDEEREQQRVAIARAFSNRPRILFADEPTGNLDSDTGSHIVELLEALNRESKTTIILVTHDPTLAARAQRVIRLSDGRDVSDTSTERAA
jgi:predicted ABC-type transport system involved in lysophospholipase L1 biosynthesis ATPase subunit